MTHTIRANSGGKKQVELIGRRAIQVLCTECLGFGEVHPRDCTGIHCALNPFRGKTLLAYDREEEEERAG